MLVEGVLMRKIKEKTHVEMLAQELILDTNEATKLDNYIKAYIAVNLTDNKNEEIENVILKGLQDTSRYKDGVNKQTKSKCKLISRRYLYNNEMWLFFEGMMCVVACCVSLCAMIDTIIREFVVTYKNIVSQDAVLLVASLMAMVIALWINKKKCSARIKLIIDIFNRFSPTIILISTVLFYYSRMVNCIILTIGNVLFFIGFLIYIICYKYKIYVKYMNKTK